MCCFFNLIYCKQITLRLKQFLCFILFLTVFFINLSTWSLSNTGKDSLVFQGSCHVPVNSCSQPERLFPKQISPLLLEPDLIPFSDQNTCQCSGETSEQNPMFRFKLPAPSFQRFFCIIPATPFNSFNSYKKALWEQGIVFVPPDHLESLSTIVIIV